MDLEKSGACLLSAGLRSTIPHREEKKKSNVNMKRFNLKTNGDGEEWLINGHKISITQDE